MAERLIYVRGAQTILKNDLSGEEFLLLESGLDAVGQLLPHLELVDRWSVNRAQTGKTAAILREQGTRLALTIRLAGTNLNLSAVLRRRQSTNAGREDTAIDTRERALAGSCLTVISKMLAARGLPSEMLDVVATEIAELAVSEYLTDVCNLEIPTRELLQFLRMLSEESYENRPIAYGLLIDTTSGAKTRSPFPGDYRAKKKFKALTDGYRTALLVSRAGKVESLVDLARRARDVTGEHYYPDWTRDMALASREGRIGFSLTRQGDILVFEDGTLRLTYRRGRWQYWNHRHIIALMSAVARAQRVPPKLIQRVVRSIYRHSLNLSFKRSGGLFVLLKARYHLHEIVRQGDALGERKVGSPEEEFEEFLSDARLQDLDHSVVIELASLDGAVVLRNSGQILAYGAVLETKKPAGIKGTEGSRTKAAIGASHYGLAVKISADGDITFYRSGKELLRM